MVVVFFCLASDHVKTLSHRWRVWEWKQGGGGWAPRREKVCGGVRFWKGNWRENDCSPDVTLMPTSNLLFLIYPFPSVSVLWVQFSMTWGFRREGLSCHCLFLWLIALTLSHRSNTAFPVCAVRLWLRKPQSNRSSPPVMGGEVKIGLSFLP